MRKVFAFEVASLDGYYVGPNQEFDWPVVDREFDEFSQRQLEEVDTLLFGRVTYEMMASYWPTPEGREGDPKTAAAMNDLPKLVASRTLDRVEWENSTLVRGDVAEELARLKQQPGKDIAIFGSFDLTVSLLRAGLVDELRIMVSPLLLGDGLSLFRTAPGRTSLELLDVRRFDSGNVLLTYEPAAR
ncbi:MAG TPA: dihydrofolate reductase family protein [Actinomycetes bacterium]